jgi:hypothetical protein
MKIGEPSGLGFRARGMLSSDLLSGAKAAANYIGETPRAVYHIAENGLLPVIRKGRKLYFRKSELEAAFRLEVA